MQQHFAGTLTSRDSKRHIPHRFDVPPGCDVLEIDFQYRPPGAQGINNRPTLSFYGPRGFRGAGHRGGQHHLARITADSATPGYLPGPLPSGEWTVEIDTHMVTPGEPLRYELTVTASRRQTRRLPPSLPPGREALSSPRYERLRSRELEGGPSTPATPGWYRGDLHTHTHHSDAADFTVRDLAELAQAYDLDFLFLTDHNTVSGLLEAHRLPPGSPLVCDGMELTTFYGHALCLGTADWVDWRIAPGTGGMAAVADAAAARDQLFVIAHPQADGDPGCTGCAWRFGDMMPGNAPAVEVWNGPWCGDSNNAFALALTYDWLNQGHRLVLTAGTDVHGPPPADMDVVPGFTVIQADALSQRALLDSLRAGHAYLSSGPALALEACGAGGETWGMGDSATSEAEFALAWTDTPPDAEVLVLVDGKTLLRHPSGTEGDLRWTLAPTDGHWVVVEIRAENGDLLALTNPTYLDVATS